MSVPSGTPAPETPRDRWLMGAIQREANGIRIDGFRAWSLIDFVRESNRIENIHREPTHAEMRAHEAFLSRPVIDVASLEIFVAAIAPGKPLRDQEGMDVRVGSHRPTPGGPHVRICLSDLLRTISRDPTLGAYEAHHGYENLHPFMDGNGRSGRALWLKMMGGIDHAPLGFLHHWYYQSLDARQR